MAALKINPPILPQTCQCGLELFDLTADGHGECRPALTSDLSKAAMVEA